MKAKSINSKQYLAFQLVGWERNIKRRKHYVKEPIPKDLIKTHWFTLKLWILCFCHETLQRNKSLINCFRPNILRELTTSFSAIIIYQDDRTKFLNFWKISFEKNAEVGVAVQFRLEQHSYKTKVPLCKTIVRFCTSCAKKRVGVLVEKIRCWSFISASYWNCESLTSRFT